MTKASRGPLRKMDMNITGHVSTESELTEALVKLDPAITGDTSSSSTPETQNRYADKVLTGQKRTWTSSNQSDPSNNAQAGEPLHKRARKDNIELHVKLTSSPSATLTCPQHMRIFHNLYQMLSLDSHRGFDKFTARCSEAEVLKLIDTALRTPVKQLLLDECYTDKEKLLAVGGDIRYQGPGWYMDVLTEDGDVHWFKLYVGQGERLKIRIEYHKKPSVLKKNSALHYQLLRKSGRRYNFVVLGTLPEVDGVDTQLLDVVEMYLGLLFQALPPKTLTKCLPNEILLRQPERGCMVANPLNQHHDDEAARRAACQLRDSTDPEVRDHYKDACDYLRSVEYVPTMEAMRLKSKKQDLFRGPSNQFEKVVHIMCNTCKSDATIKQDPAPIFDKESSKYLVRQQSCFNCPVAGAKKGDRRQFKSTMFYPVDGRPTMSMSWLGKHAKEPKSTNQYESHGRWKKPTVILDSDE